MGIQDVMCTKSTTCLLPRAWAQTSALMKVCKKMVLFFVKVTIHSLSVCLSFCMVVRHKWSTRSTIDLAVGWVYKDEILVLIVNDSYINDLVADGTEDRIGYRPNDGWLLRIYSLVLVVGFISMWFFFGLYQTFHLISSTQISYLILSILSDLIDRLETA